MLLYIAVENPNDKATHIKVYVRHTQKKVVLSVDPVHIGGGFIRQAFHLASGRNGWLALCDMPRLAPKQFKQRCQGVKDAVLNRKTDDFVWTMIREAAAEAGVKVPETGVLQVEEK